MKYKIDDKIEVEIDDCCGCQPQIKTVGGRFYLECAYHGKHSTYSLCKTLVGAIAEWNKRVREEWK